MDNPILSTHNRQSRLSVLRFGAWLLSILSVSEFGSAFASVSPLAVSFCSLYSPVHLPFVFLSILILIPKPFLFFPQFNRLLSIFKHFQELLWSLVVFRGSWSAFPGREKEMNTRERAELASYRERDSNRFIPTGWEEKGCWLDIL